MSVELELQSMRSLTCSFGEDVQLRLGNTLPGLEEFLGYSKKLTSKGEPAGWSKSCRRNQEIRIWS